MNAYHRLTASVCLLAVVSHSTLAWAAEAAPSGAPRIVDVKLTTNGELRGAIVDPSGQPRRRSVLEFRGTRTRMQTTSNERGQFAVQLAPGVYEVRCGARRNQVRIWSHQAAPPHAAPALLTVQGAVVRGQCNNCGKCRDCCGGFGSRFGGRSQAWLVGGALLGAAVVLPMIDDPDGS